MGHSSPSTIMAWRVIDMKGLGPLYRSAKSCPSESPIACDKTFMFLHACKHTRPHLMGQLLGRVDELIRIEWVAKKRH